MSMNAPIQQHSSISDFVVTHQPLVIGGGIVAVLLLAGLFLNSKNKTMPASSTNGTGPADLSGLQNGNLVYVPTSTNFDTTNIKYGPQVNSNDPNLTSVSGTQNVTGPTTTVNKPIAVVPPVIIKPVIPPVVSPPVSTPPTGSGHRTTPPTPVPVNTRGKALIWDQKHTFVGGETLSSVAAGVTSWLRRYDGMPATVTVTWNDLYAHNTNIINSYAQRYGSPVKSSFGTNDPAGPWNNVFPGETIVTPRWG